jgi:poly(A) polymerase
MPEILPAESNRPPSRREDAEAVLRRLREAGHVAYFAGGCVRDTLLGTEPKDWDVATDAPPPRVRQLFARTQAVGAAFGVILVRQGASQVEVATFRTDVSYEDGRRPTAVKFTTAEEDAKRRDFTINGLFLDPIENKVIDYVGGQEDLKRKVLRAIGEPNHRFEEDHLRLLRAVRFASRFGLTIEPATAAAIRAHAPQLKWISPERIAEELRLMLTPVTRAAAFDMLVNFGLLDIVFRFVDREIQSASEIFHRLAPGRSIPFSLALAGIVAARFSGATLDKPFLQKLTKAKRQALRPSNEELDDFVEILEGVRLLREAPQTLAFKKRFLARPTSKLTRVLMDAIAGDSQEWNERRRELDLLEAIEFAPAPLITGDDLTAAGYQPGPMFKRVLEAVYDAQLEDRVGTKDQAMLLARELFKRK